MSSLGAHMSGGSMKDNTYAQHSQPTQPRRGCASARKADVASAWLLNAESIAWTHVQQLVCDGCGITARPLTWCRQNETTCTSPRRSLTCVDGEGCVRLMIRVLLTWHISYTDTDGPCFPPVAPLMFDHKKAACRIRTELASFTQYMVNFGTSLRSLSTSFSLTSCALFYLISHHFSQGLWETEIYP